MILTGGESHPYFFKICQRKILTKGDIIYIIVIVTLGVEV